MRQRQEAPLLYRKSCENISWELLGESDEKRNFEGFIFAVLRMNFSSFRVFHINAQIRHLLTRGVTCTCIDRSSEITCFF